MDAATAGWCWRLLFAAAAAALLSWHMQLHLTLLHTQPNRSHLRPAGTLASGTAAPRAVSCSACCTAAPAPTTTTTHTHVRTGQWWLDRECTINVAAWEGPLLVLTSQWFLLLTRSGLHRLLRLAHGQVRTGGGMRDAWLRPAGRGHVRHCSSATSHVRMPAAAAFLSPLDT